MFRLISLFLLCSFCFAQNIEVGKPEGFDGFDDPQNLIIDVFYGSKKITSTEVIASEDFIKFIKPEDILDNIRNLKKENYEELSTILLYSQNANSYASCHRKEKNCGKISYKNIGFIYTPEIFRVDVFLKQKLLSKSNNLPQFFPVPNQGFSYLSGVTATAVDNDLSKARYSARSRNFIAYNNNYIESLTSIDEKFALEDISAVRNSNEKEYRLGFFQLDDTFLLTSPKVFGASISSSIIARSDFENLYSNDIQIFFRDRARVVIKKDDKVIASDVYDAGNQSIDTSRLPTGAYDITLEINENGNIRTETRFFIKSTRIIPKDQDLYWAQAGMLQENSSFSVPRFQNYFISRVGYGKRINQNLSVISNIIFSEKQSAMEANLYFESKLFQINNSYMASTENDLATSIEIITRYKNLISTISARQQKEGRNNEDPYDIISSDSSSIRLSADYRLGNKTIGFLANYIDNNKAEYSYGPRLRWNMLRNKGYNADLDATLLRQKDSNEMMMNVRLFKNYDYLTVSSTSTANIRNEKSSKLQKLGSDFSSTQVLTWNDKDIFDNDLIVTAINTISDVNENKEIGFDYQSDMGRFNAEIRNTQNSTNINADMQFNIAYNKHLDIGGKNLRQSGILVDISGNSSNDEKFSILIDGAKRAIVKNNTKTIIPLSPFRIYRVDIKPEGSEYSDIIGGQEDISLYPGTIKTVSYVAKKAVIILSSLVDAKGDIIKNAYLKSDIEESFSDESGFFQISAFNDSKLVVKYNNQSCEFKVPSEVGLNSVISLEKIICR